ncbi:hypothetical protein PGT21_023136 [Puccinia graminis f. sp. tritici]|uniref:Uncharacterized protein n=1 Tax=Puccinia graminis f. sp. tritici TaxID=56615 RepID=A0A5B0NF17_PUCGR|nr:hypothetical protein PGT21_023136 [Puccinia graminis f. sp. tritici]
MSCAADAAEALKLTIQATMPANAATLADVTCFIEGLALSMWRQRYVDLIVT